MNHPSRAVGALVLVPNTLDHGADALGDVAASLPLAVMQRAATIRHWVVEDAKSARAFLRRVSTRAELAAPLQQIEVRELPRPPKGRDGTPSSTAELQALLAPARQGHDVGLLSEAGLPAVADPGSALVREAHGLGLRVEPLPGPSALMLALAASGLNGQHFAFQGYLPVEADARAKRIRELEGVSRQSAQTQIAIETPYRNAALLQALIDHLRPTTRLAVACALTWPEGWCRTQTVKVWRERPTSIDNRLPAVFLWSA